MLFSVLMVTVDVDGHGQWAMILNDADACSNGL